MYRFAQQVYCFAGNPKAVKIGMYRNFVAQHAFLNFVQRSPMV
jgi:hypothetical protein